MSGPTWLEINLINGVSVKPIKGIVGIPSAVSPLELEFSYTKHSPADIYYWYYAGASHKSQKEVTH